MAFDCIGIANEECKKGNYQRAIELYTEAVMMDPSREEAALVERAEAHLKLKEYEDAVKDCDQVLALNSKNVQAYLRKGTGLFYMEDYAQALETFRAGAPLADDKSAFEMWMEKCEIKIEERRNGVEGSAEQATTNGAAAAVEANPSPASVTAVIPAKPKYDWYQTEMHVVVTLLHKNTKREDLVYETTDTTLKVHTKEASGEDVDLDIHLSHPINPDHTTAKVMASKVEVKLKKSEGVQWAKLEGDGQKFALKLPSAITGAALYAGTATEGGAVAANRYPSSSHYTRNWDKLEAEMKEEEKNEKLEGDAALNKLFQQIYADGSDDVKKAMMKSFSESGGTVLSTNWLEVKKDKVEVKPPDGMEYKKYTLVNHTVGDSPARHTGSRKKQRTAEKEVVRRLEEVD